MRLDGAVDIGCAAELQGLLVEALAEPAAVTVVVAEGTEMDVTAMQLLVAADRAAREKQHVWRVPEPWPQDVVRAWRDAGFVRIPFADDAQ